MRNLIILIFVLGFTSTAVAQRVDTANYYKCNDRVSGRWVFGVAPSACSVDPFISKNIVRDKFSLYTFDENKVDSTERTRYINDLVDLLSASAEYYIKKRQPGVSQTEIDWWKRIVLTIASHESFFTHYREGKDSKLRMMRGDFGHGHGLMQVDDRWHFANVNSGEAAHIIKNLFYALDIFHKGWVQSKTASCISNPEFYYSRARAAYGVYNGGAAQVCRWTNPNHRWARNDVNFKEAFDAKKWERYLSSSHESKPVNVACLVSDSADCTGSTNTTDPVETLNNILNYKNFYCALDDDTYYCLSQEKYKSCLISEFNLSNETVQTTTDKPIVLLRPSDICPGEDKIYEVGSFIRVNKNINLRATAGGTKIGLLSQNSTYQILGSEIKSDSDKSRYYLVRSNNKLGFFFAGTKDSATEWASKTTTASEVVLPVEGSIISIQTNSGTNLRRTPAGVKVGVAGSKQEFKVLDTVFVGKTNKFYVKINVNGTIGWVYSGQIHPLYSISNWIKLEQR